MNNHTPKFLKIPVIEANSEKLIITPIRINVGAIRTYQPGRRADRDIVNKDLADKYTGPLTVLYIEPVNPRSTAAVSYVLSTIDCDILDRELQAAMPVSDCIPEDL